MDRIYMYSASIITRYKTYIPNPIDGCQSLTTKLKEASNACCYRIGLDGDMWLYKNSAKQIEGEQSGKRIGICSQLN